MKTIFYQVPEYYDDQIFEIAVHENTDLNDRFDAMTCARRAGEKFFEKTTYEWANEETITIFFYETQSAIYRADVMLDYEPYFVVEKISHVKSEEET